MFKTYLTLEELKAKIRALGPVGHTTIKAGMRNASANVCRRAKLNCTPGESPYDSMVFSTKLIETTRTGKIKWSQAKFSVNQINRSGAPFNKGDLRKSITYKVDDDGTTIVGVVGTNISYALDVHDGTSKMESRPFIYDAVMREHDATMEYLALGIDAALQQCAEGNLWFNPTQLGIIPTMPDDTTGEEE
jgi:phage gpG-like protein